MSWSAIMIFAFTERIKRYSVRKSVEIISD